jgi:hypothetical protein
MAQLSFGPGIVWGERVDNAVIDPTTKLPEPLAGTGPTQFGITQKASVNWSFTDKPLYGQQQFPVAVARGQGKVDIKITNAQFNMLLFADIFFGLTPTVGQFSVAQSEVIVAAGGYSVINAATFLDDLGVRYNDSGNHLYRISGGTPPENTDPNITPLPLSGAGTYSVDLTSGAYTFDGADAGLELVVSYAYATADTGVQLSITNQGQGFTPAWKCTFFQQTSPGQAGANTSDQPLALRLNACVSSKLTLPNSAIDAWTIPELDAMAFSNAAGEIGVLSMIQL